MSGDADLARFIEVQAGVYPHALAELTAGAKRGHWMWFIFPQIAGLGASEMSRRYAIADLAHAAAYLSHPVLGERLRRCVQALLAHRDLRAADILGAVDAAKLRSSMTLFEQVAPGDPLFARCLDAFFAGQRDLATLARLRSGTMA